MKINEKNLLQKNNLIIGGNGFYNLDALPTIRKMILQKKLGDYTNQKINDLEKHSKDFFDKWLKLVNSQIVN